MCRTRQTITACVHSSRLSQKTTGFIIAWIGRLKSWENDPEGSGCCKCWEWSLYHDPLRHSPRLTICPPSFINLIQQTVHDGFTHTEPFAVQLSVHAHQKFMILWTPGTRCSRSSKIFIRGADLGSPPLTWFSSWMRLRNWSPEWLNVAWDRTGCLACQTCALNWNGYMGWQPSVVNAFKELVAGVIECRVGQDGVFTHGAGCAFLIA